MSAPDQRQNNSGGGSPPQSRFPPPPPVPTPPVSVNATANHPLAFPPPPPPPPVQQQQNLAVVRPSHSFPPHNAHHHPPSLQQHAPVVTSKPLQVARGGSGGNHVDAMADAFLRANSDDPSNVRLRPDPLPESGMDRLRELVVRRNWSSVVTMAHDLLHSPNSYSPLYRALLHNPQALSASIESQQQDVVEIMSLYAHGLLYTDRHSDLCRLVDSWSFLQHVGGAAPEWIPVSLHVLGACTLQFMYDADDEDSTKAAADALYSIRDGLSTTDNDKTTTCSPVDFWHVDYALANLFIVSKKWRLVLASLERMRDSAGEVAKAEVEKLMAPGQRAVATLTLQHAYECLILSDQGRVLLQAGATSEAQIILEQAESVWKALEGNPVDEKLENHSAILHIKAQLAANEGLWCFADGKYGDALEFFRQSSREVVIDISYNRDDWVSFSLVSQQARFDMYGQVLNNMACCALYTCRLADGIAVLENVVRQNPAFLTERIATNLCTLYELASDTPIATRQKQTLQALAQRFALNDVQRKCFRVG